MSLADPVNRGADADRAVWAFPAVPWQEAARKRAADVGERLAVKIPVVDPMGCKKPEPPSSSSRSERIPMREVAE